MTNYVMPQLRIFQEFAADTSVTTAPLGACILAPFYKSFIDADVGQYATAGKVAVYPGLSGTDSVSLSDSANFAARIKGALVERLKVTEDTAFSFSGLNMTTEHLLADSSAVKVPAGFRAFQVGDTVRFVYAAAEPFDTTITGFFSDGTIPEATPAVTTPAGQTLSVTVDSLELTAPRTLTGTITRSFKAGTDNPSFVVTDDTGNIVYSNTGTTDTYQSLAIYPGVILDFTDTDIWWEGDTFVIGVYPEMAEVAGGYNGIALASAPEGSPTGFSILCVEDIELTPVTTTANANLGQIQFTEAGITAPAGLKYDGCPVFGGDIKIDFRAKSTQYSGTVFSCGNAAEAEELFGDLTDKNPLGLGVLCALLNSNGRPVSFIGTATETAAGYTDAMDLLEADAAAYGIVPCTTNPAILLAIQSRIAYMSGAEVMNWKTGWFAADLPADTTVLSSLTGTSSGATSITLAGGSLANVVVGDRVLFSNGKSVGITGVAVVSGIVSTDAYVPAGTHTGISIKHTLTPLERAAYTVNSYNDYRIRLVVTPGIALATEPGTIVSNVYMAAACAGYRSGVAPHQPLTRAEVAGFVIPSMTGFSATVLNSMAANGIWLVVRDTAGAVFVRHQLTTDVTNYKTREDSKISNADEISRYVRDQLKDYYGRANISDEFIDTVYLQLITAAQNIKARPYSVLIGPQIQDYTSPSITRDPALADRLIIRMRFTTPDPANYLDVYLTIV